MNATTRATLRFCGRCALMTVSLCLLGYVTLYHRPVTGPQQGQETLAEKIERHVDQYKSEGKGREALDQELSGYRDIPQNPSVYRAAGSKDTP